MVQHVGVAVVEDLSYGFQKTHYNGGMSYQTGKVVGHVFDMVLGAIGTIGGGTFAAATAPTGVGIAAGIGEAIYASSVMVSAGKNLSDDLMNVHFDPATGGGGGSASSTPEFDVNDPESFKGASAQEVEQWLKDNGWGPKEPSRKGGGVRFKGPNYGEQIRIMPGYTAGNRSNIMKTGPYMEICVRGRSTYVPLEGNPTLP